MRYDPYTLIITLGPQGTAEGELYIDDGESYEYQDGAYIHRRFVFSAGRLTSEDLADKSVKEKKRREFLKTMSSVRVEKIIIIDAPAAWEGKSTVGVSELETDREVEMAFFKGDGTRANWAVVRNPGVGVGRGWRVSF